MPASDYAVRRELKETAMASRTANSTLAAQKAGE